MNHLPKGFHRGHLHIGTTWALWGLLGAGWDFQAALARHGEVS
jgi:hypothetical protein